jgi:hypothetical protein
MRVIKKDESKYKNTCDDCRLLITQTELEINKNVSKEKLKILFSAAWRFVIAISFAGCKKHKKPDCRVLWISM